MTHAIAITTANISDRAGALLASKQHKPTLSNVKSVLIDDGYTGDPFAESVKELFNATVQVAKRLAMPPPTKISVSISTNYHYALSVGYRAIAFDSLAVFSVLAGAVPCNCHPPQRLYADS